MNRAVRRVIGCAALAALAGASPLPAQTGPDGGGDEAELREELRYVEMLQQMRMPDMAEEVIAGLKKRFPEAAAQLKVKEIAGMLSLGKFDDVKKIIGALPDRNGPEYWAMTLATGDAYYAFRRYPEADKIYRSFFTKVEKPGRALLSIYRESAYKYAQMLLLLGREEDALEAYRWLVRVPLDGEIRGKVDADMAELMIKLAQSGKKKGDRAALLDEADKLADKLLWKQNVQFGSAIVIKAHVRLLRGDVKGAQDLVEDYMPQLKIIHDALKAEDPDGSRGELGMSPMPQCRYLLATLLLDEALGEIKKPKPDEARIKDLLLGTRDPVTKRRKGNGAFNHFINVFLRYPESQWASESGAKSDAVRKLIKERYGAELGTRVTPEQMAKVRRLQFTNADLAFSQNQFKKAAELYLTVLNQFPESEESVYALGNLALCYMEEADADADAGDMADMVVGYLSERFCENPALKKRAGDRLLQIADRYAELKREDKRREVHELFFRDYPGHYATAQLLMTFAEREFKAGNWDAAEKYYRRIAGQYPGSTHYYSALNRIAQVYGEKGERTNEIAALEFYVKEVGSREFPGEQLTAGQFRLADACREYGVSFSKAAATNAALSAEGREALQREAAGWLFKAARQFTAITKGAPGGKAAGERGPKEELGDAARFLTAVCLTQINYPKEKIPAFRKAAVKAFEGYVEKCPDGKYAPRAVMQIGTLHTALGDAEKAQDTFNRLAKEYPGSEEAKNSVPMLAAALIDMGLRGEGVAKYRQMFAVGGKYTLGQFLAAAKALEGSGEFGLALQAYDKALSLSPELGTQANALIGKARAQFGMKDYAAAHKTLKGFMEDKRLSRLQQMIDANMLLVDVASEEGRTERDDKARTKLFNEAIDALKMVRNYTTPKGADGRGKRMSQWTSEEVARDANLRLMSGDVLVRRMEAEKAMKLDEKAAETRGEAIVAFMGMVMGMDPGRAELRPALEKAYARTIPLMLEHKKFEDVIGYCQEYLKLFPDGRHTTDVNNWMNQAKIGQ